MGLASATLLSLLFLAQDGADGVLKSKDPEVRLAAIRGLVGKTEGDEAPRVMANGDTEKILLGALDDDDWEIVQIASLGLGALASKRALEPLVELALNGPVRGIRREAAIALAKIDSEKAYHELSKKLAGELAPLACEAILELAPAIDGKVSTAFLDKASKSKDAATRRAAARTIAAVSGEEREEKLRELLGSEDLVVRAFALEGAELAADPSVLPLLLEYQRNLILDDVLERRAFRALRAAALSAEDPRSVERSIAAAIGAGSAIEAKKTVADSVRVRFARLIGHLAEQRDEKRALDAAFALQALEALSEDGSADIRAAVAGALGRIATREALAGLAELLERDADGRVRLIAFLALARERTQAAAAERSSASDKDATEQSSASDEDALRSFAIDRLAKDSDARMREAAAVELGVRGLERGTEALIGALSDSNWQVAVAAAVSLGKTQSSAGIEPLTKLYSDSPDWKLRGGAVVGLGKLRQKEGVPALLRALEDPEPAVRRTAHEFFKAVSGLDHPPEVKPWTEWWEQNRDRVQLSVPEAVLERRKRYEYAGDADPGISAVNPSPIYGAIYGGLDVLVLQSEDHIEEVFEFLGLEHRVTRSGKLVADEIHPGCVFVANCSGQMTAEEIERVAWFVHTGGYLFGSCWALRESIAAAVPGFVRRFQTGQVLDDVPAYPCDPKSAWLAGVFAPGVRPIYHLEGAFLIEVVDPERVEVLIDSPECAAAWGNGNLAAWFRAGHGIVLDSANHFDLQGFDTATGLKKPEDRMAYAVDHMGLSYAELRQLKDEKFWGRPQTTSEKIRDLSVVRLVTNFVRHKRIGED